MSRENRAKTAVVTGGSMGIGRGIALALAAEGYDLVIAHYQEPAEAAEVADRIQREYGRDCFVFQGDLGKHETPEKLLEFAAATLGDIHVLVNNAGLKGTTNILNIDPGYMDRIIATNFRAPILLMQLIAKHMITRGVKGSIVNITSSRAQRAYPGDVVYGGLKAALERAAQSIALDLAPYGIRVNCVAPGAIKVRDDEQHNVFYQALGPRIPLERPGTPEDIGNAVAWLVSDKSSYVTGIVVRVDGGLILPGMPERDSHAVWGAVPRRDRLQM
ncbi:SDR family NAD(P)-dependent oxidoreductase [Paenibacillus xerothermodurans]|uniref:SDR family NAD(P)-dependent oxidoreductase n=1 Tax=Paenibacillus xerothermodurans TaxID=1977292 RepID=A0A2W1P0L9_PAEXE|nr:SDR family oxidoreductase [Paenibacillus xerothermodurans]PZE20628.1 SDR family NAD(P)-dependent oxidoreductase [Paenibacillus xerothermodurans]